ncbi:hypothetical protein BgiBS90_035606 [Biomphalaria glabrata]|nr:hypothetical protein BgiBS90_035606 [Biomphalaria glabrata]
MYPYSRSQWIDERCIRTAEVKGEMRDVSVQQKGEMYPYSRRERCIRTAEVKGERRDVYVFKSKITKAVHVDTYLMYARLDNHTMYLVSQVNY